MQSSSPANQFPHFKIILSFFNANPDDWPRHFTSVFIRFFIEKRRSSRRWTNRTATELADYISLTTSQLHHQHGGPAARILQKRHLPKVFPAFAPRQRIFTRKKAEIV
jgi:NADPH-dependent ferric siderophore reductase